MYLKGLGFTEIFHYPTLFVFLMAVVTGGISKRPLDDTKPSVTHILVLVSSVESLHHLKYENN